MLLRQFVIKSDFNVTILPCSVAKVLHSEEIYKAINSPPFSEKC